MASREARHFDDLLEPVIEETRELYSLDAAARTRGFQAVLALEPELQARLVLHCLSRASKLHKAAERIDEPVSSWGGGCSEKYLALTRSWGAASCALSILRRELPWSDSQLEKLVKQSIHLDAIGGHWRTFGGLLKQLEANLDRVRSSRRIMRMLETLGGEAPQYRDAQVRRMQTRLCRVLGEDAIDRIEAGEAWSDRARHDLQSLDDDARTAWSLLIEHASCAQGSAPSAKWTRDARGVREGVGDAAFVSVAASWFDLVDKPRTIDRPARGWVPDQNHLIQDTHGDILKGLCWIASTIPDPDLARALGRLVISAYRKVPGIGPRAAKIGNAAVYALGQIPGRDSLGQLAMLRVKVKFGTAQKLLEKALTAAAEREGLPRDEIEELAVPSYGLTDIGVRREQLGDYTAELRITGIAKPVLGFIKPDGKPQKSVPAAIKESHAADIKELKAAAKDIGAMLPAQRNRLDGLFLQNKSWDLPTWQERYLDHPLVGVIARRLIWRFAPAKDSKWDANTNAQSAIWVDGKGLTGLDGTPLNPKSKNTRICLWHPIEVPQDEIFAWREFLETREIVQPFKQARREVYLLTDAERTTGTYSNRYAAHVLRQHQFNALCAARGWKNKLRLLVDAEYPPALRFLPAWGLRAEFWIEGAGEDYDTDVNEAGVFHHIVTDQVRFYSSDAATNSAHAFGGSYGMYAGENDLNNPLALDTIPPLVFSEIMRDVDLFVGVTSVGNNPQWQDGGPEGRYHEYWWSYSFGDLSATAETRRDILRSLVPRLTIADRCTIEGKFLIIRGDIRTYKIHLGSSNILMQPNDQYLCIIPGRSDPKLPQKIYLPFEGDRTLSIILSKAFLLADDAAINDRAITSQIGIKQR